MRLQINSTFRPSTTRTSSKLLRRKQQRRQQQLLGLHSGIITRLQSTTNPLIIGQHKRKFKINFLVIAFL
jgi:hypothetical protein